MFFHPDDKTMTSSHLARRQFLRTIAGAGLIALLAGCAPSDDDDDDDDDDDGGSRRKSKGGKKGGKRR